MKHAQNTSSAVRPSEHSEFSSEYAYLLANRKKLSFELWKGNLIHKNSFIGSSVIIGEQNIIYPNTTIGLPPQSRIWNKIGGVSIGDRNVFREGTSVHHPTKGATNLGSNNYIMSHSIISHDCQLEDNITIASGLMLAGHVYIMRNATIGLNCTIHQWNVIGSFTMIGQGSNVTKECLVEPGYKVYGSPAKPRGFNELGMLRNNVKNDFLLDERTRFYRIRKELQLMKNLS